MTIAHAIIAIMSTLAGYAFGYARGRADTLRAWRRKSAMKADT